MSGFKKGQLKAEFAAKQVQLELNNATTEADPKQTKTHAVQNKQTEIELNTARKEGGAHSIGRIETAQDQSEKNSTERQRKKDKKFSDYVQQLHQRRQDLERQLEWLVKYFEQKAEEAKEQADKLRQKVADNYEQMGKNSDFIGAIDKLLKAHENGDPFDQDKLRKLLKEQGRAINDHTPLAILLHTAEEMIIKADDNNRHLEIDNEIHERNIEKFEQTYKESSATAKELQSELDNLKAQNLSDEEYTRQASKILEGVPFHIKREYEQSDKSENISAQEEAGYHKKKQEVESFDPFAKSDVGLDNTKEIAKNGSNPLPSPGM